VGAVADELAVALDEEARLVHGDDHGQLLAASDLEVLGAAAGGDVDDSRALVEADLGVGHDAVDDLGLCRQIVEARGVRTADQLLAADAADDPRVGSEDGAAALLGHEVALAADLHPDVLRVGLDCRGDVRGQRPGRRGPDDERLPRRIGEAEAHVQRRVDDVAIGVRSCDFVL